MPSGWMRNVCRALGMLPPPCSVRLPSPLWGGVGGGGRGWRTQLAPQLRPPSPALPHKGGGSRLSLPIELIPLQRNRIYDSARGQLIGREIIDRNGGGARFHRGMQLRGLGIIDQGLPFRLVDVAHARAAHALAQRLGRGDEREGALEARDPVVTDAVEDIDGEALACGRGAEQNVGAGLRQPVGRTAAVGTERQG